MGVSRMQFQGGSAFWILPTTLGTGADAGKYNGIGTPIKFDAVEKNEYEFPFTGDAGNQEFLSQQLANGITIEAAKVTKVYDTTGALKASSGSGAVHKLSVTMTETDHQFLLDMLSIDDAHVIAVFPQSDTDEGGYGYLLAKPSGSIKVSRAGNTPQTVVVEFSGVELSLASTKTAADVVTEVTAGTTSIVQLGGATLAPATGGPIVAADVPRLLSGKLVFKKT